MQPRLTTILLASILMTLSGCPGSNGGGGSDNDNVSQGDGQNTDDGGTGQGRPVIVPATTVALAPADLDALESTSDDLTQLVFASDSTTLGALDAGDVLVCGVHGELLPYGMLRKVVQIQRDAGQVIVQTEQAALTEAIERGTLDESFTLDAGTIVSRSSAHFRAASGLEEGQGFVFAINDYELYDADGNPATTGDRVWADGNFSFSPEVSFTIDIDGFELQTLTFDIGAEQQSSIRVTAGREATFSEVEILESIELTPITFSIGPVPVVLVPRLVFRVGIDGTITADLTAGVQTDASVSVGFGYQDGGFGPTSDFDAGAGFDAPNFRDGSKGTARVWAGPRAELAAYGIAGVYGELRGFVQADVDALANPWWTLSAGVEALAGVFLRVFDITIADYETDLLEESIQLAQADGPAPSGGSEVVTWARSFGGPERDNIENPLAIMETADGGSLMVGGTNSFTSSPSDAWLLKLDRLGQVSWQRAIDDLGVGIGAVVLSDGGYVLLTSTIGTGANRVHLAGLDANGDLLWGNRYESDKPIAGHQILVRDDQVYVGGVYGAGIEAEFWFASFDGNGQPTWSIAIGGDQGDQIDGLAFTQDGGLLGVGPSHSFDVSFNGFFTVKLDLNGDLDWAQGFDGAGNEWMHAVVPDADGNYKLVGRTGSDALVAKLNGSGTLLEAASYDGGSPFEEAFGALGTPDGGLLIAGNTGLGDDADLWLLRLTSQLEVLWTTSYGGPLGDEAGGTIQHGPVSTPLAMSADGGFLVLSNTESFGASFYDAWVQKVSGTGTILYDDGSDAQSTSLAGSFQDYGIESVPTTVTQSSVALTITPVELELYTPEPRIVIQSTP